MRCGGGAFPVLLDLPPAAVDGPLALLQGTVIERDPWSIKREMLALLSRVTDHVNRDRNQGQIRYRPSTTWGNRRHQLDRPRPLGRLRHSGSSGSSRIGSVDLRSLSPAVRAEDLSGAVPGLRGSAVAGPLCRGQDRARRNGRAQDRASQQRCRRARSSPTNVSARPWTATPWRLPVNCSKSASSGRIVRGGSKMPRGGSRCASGVATPFKRLTCAFGILSHRCSTTPASTKSCQIWKSARSD